MPVDQFDRTQNREKKIHTDKHTTDIQHHPATWLVYYYYRGVLGSGYDQEAFVSLNDKVQRLHDNVIFQPNQW